MMSSHFQAHQHLGLGMLQTLEDRKMLCLMTKFCVPTVEYIVCDSVQVLGHMVALSWLWLWSPSLLRSSHHQGIKVFLAFSGTLP